MDSGDNMSHQYRSITLPDPEQVVNECAAFPAWSYPASAAASCCRQIPVAAPISFPPRQLRCATSCPANIASQCSPATPPEFLRRAIATAPLDPPFPIPNG